MRPGSTIAKYLFGIFFQYGSLLDIVVFFSDPIEKLILLYLSLSDRWLNSFEQLCLDGSAYVILLFLLVRTARFIASLSYRSVSKHALVLHIAVPVRH